MAECQGPATATQFQVSAVTTTIQNVVTTTQITTVTAPSRFRRQAASPSPSPTSTPSSNPTSPSASPSAAPSSDSPSGTENDVSVITNVLTLTTTQTIVQSNSALTLFAPCSSSSSTAQNPIPTSSGPYGTPLTSGQPSSSFEGDAVSRAMHTTVQDGLTVIVNQVVTDVGGEQTTIEVPVQTLLNTVTPLSSSERGGVIAGGVIGGLLITIGLLTLLFLWRRRRLNQKRQLAERQKRLATPRHFLEDELAEPMRQWDGGSPLTIESSPKLLRPRGSSTGSLFHENVWPPPQEAFHDPIMTPHDLESTVSLVMGPPPESLVSPASQRSSNDEPAVAVTTAVGAGRRAIRAQDASSISSGSIYSYDNPQPEPGHSRAMSTDPLLPRQSPSPTSPLAPLRANPAIIAKFQEATNQRTRAYRRSTLSESFTPEEPPPPPCSFPPSSYHRPSHSRRAYSAADLYTGSSPDNASDESEILRAVLTAGSSTDLASAPKSAVDLPAGASAPANGSVAPTTISDEPPPQYGTIPRDTLRDQEVG